MATETLSEDENPSLKEFSLLRKTLEINHTYQLTLIEQLACVEKCLNRNRTLQKQLKLRPGGGITKTDLTPENFVDSFGSRPPPNDDVVEKQIETESRKAKNTKKWREREIADLKFGVLQQYQETLLNVFYSSGLDPSLSDVAQQKEKLSQVTLDDIDETQWAPDWEKLASQWVGTRSAVECEVRWNSEFSQLYSRGDWDRNEDKILFSLVEQYGKNDWNSVSAEMPHPRSPLQCFIRYQRSLNTTFVKSEWEPEDDAQLLEAVNRYGTKDWNLVASALEGWKPKQCRIRWASSVDPAIRRGRFTEEEDIRIALAVQAYDEAWSKVSAHVPGRTGPQIRERWVNVLSPRRLCDGWTREEDEKLINLAREHQGKWSEICKHFQRRTDNECWRHWKAIASPEEVKEHQKTAQKKKHLVKNVPNKSGWRSSLCPTDIELLEPETTKKRKGGRASASATKRARKEK